jgi:hypothetical protein
MSNEVQVKLPMKEIVEGQEQIVTKSYFVDEPSFAQFAKLMRVLNKVWGELKDDEEMTGFIDSLFAEDVEGKESSDMDKDFMMKAMGAFDFLAVKLPERLIEIIAVLSAIDQDILEKQKITKVLDVYDAIFEANDMEVLIARIKKSFGATKKAMAFIRKKDKATQA